MIRQCGMDCTKSKRTDSLIGFIIDEFFMSSPHSNKLLAV